MKSFIGQQQVANRKVHCILLFQIILVVSFLFSGFYSAAAESLEAAEYRVEDVAGVWQKGYLDGPAKGAMFYGINIAPDNEGNIFVMDETRVRVITKEGMVWTIAGNGIRGYRDGPADDAMFNVGGRGYKYFNIGVDSKRNVYIPDGYNNRIRKIFRKSDGTWWVESWPKGASIKNPVSLAVDIYDNVWTEGHSCIYKITPSGDMSCYTNVAGNVVNMQADRRGNVYLLVRQAWSSQYW